MEKGTYSDTRCATCKPEEVFANLDHALENGCFEPDGYLFGYSVADIAEDMMLNLEIAEDEKQLIPYIEEWLKAQAK